MGAEIRASLAELARVLGIENGQIKAEDAVWTQLMQEGVIVKLHVRRWRAKARLELADLGLDQGNENRAQFAGLLELGDKRLLPLALMQELDSIESAGRKALERAGYCTYWGTLVPAANFAAWQEQNRAREARYLALGQRIVDEYWTIRDDLLASYEDSARLAHRRMLALAPETMSARERYDEEYFVAEFRLRIEGLIPPPDVIQRSFAWEVELSYIPLPALLAADQAAAERVRAERQAEAMREELAIEELQADRLLARDRERMERDALWASARIEDAAVRERRDALAAMNAAVVATAQAQKETLVEGFLRDVVVQLRSAVYEAATDVLGSLEKHGGALHPKSAEQLRNLFARVASLNFYGDQEVALALATVQEAFATDASVRSVAELQARLADLATSMRGSLLAMGDAPRSASRLGVVDVPSDALVLAARRRLGSDLDVQPVEIGASTGRQVVELF